MRALLPLAMLIGLGAAALLLLAGRSDRGDRMLGGDPAAAREIQDARPLTPRQEAWRWAATILGILVVGAVILFGLALIARAIWDL